MARQDLGEDLVKRIYDALDGFVYDRRPVLWHDIRRAMCRISTFRLEVSIYFLALPCRWMISHLVVRECFPIIYYESGGLREAQAEWVL